MCSLVPDLRLAVGFEWEVLATAQGVITMHNMPKAQTAQRDRGLEVVCVSKAENNIRQMRGEELWRRSSCVNGFSVLGRSGFLNLIWRKNQTSVRGLGA